MTGGAKPARECLQAAQLELVVVDSSLVAGNRCIHFFPLVACGARNVLAPCARKYRLRLFGQHRITMVCECKRLMIIGEPGAIDTLSRSELRCMDTRRPDGAGPVAIDSAFTGQDSESQRGIAIGPNWISQHELGRGVSG